MTDYMDINYGRAHTVSDDDDASNTFEGAQFPRYLIPLAPAKPFLMPSFNDEVVEVLPSEKANRKIRFAEDILVQEIQNRYNLVDAEEDNDSYEIEIVQDDGDADFYLEIVDGEVFYVFETEDDISVDSSDEASDNSSPENNNNGRALQLSIEGMSAPNLVLLQEASDDDDEDNTSVQTGSVFDASMNISIRSGFADMDASTSDVNYNDDSMIELAVPIKVQANSSDIQQQQPSVTQTGSSSEPFMNSSMSPTKETVQDTAAVAIAPSDSIPSTPKSPQKSNVSVNLVDRVPLPSPNSEPASPSGGRSVSSKKSILKSCPESPKVVIEKKPKKTKNGEKTFTKTYVRADTFDGEHRVYAWEKPSWAETPALKLTGQGDAIRKGKNLASPITSATKNTANSHLINEDGTIDEAAIIEKMKRVTGQSYIKGMKKLKFSVGGTAIRSGGDIVKPITAATQRTEEDHVNKVADPKMLKATATGEQARKGVSLSGPVTAAPQVKRDLWEKPDWAKGSIKLRGTEHGKLAKAGLDFVAPISLNRSHDEEDNKPGTPANNSDFRKKTEWEKPSWTKTKLRSSDQGLLAKTIGDLAKPITKLPDMAKQSNK
jgi:hypothetical protein